MKKIISVLLTLVICFSAFSVVAYAEEGVAPLTFTIDEEGFAVLASCDTAVEGEIIVPAVVEIDGQLYEVKTIGDSAFAGCELITTVTISEGVEMIEDFAFLDCSALEHVYAPESLLFCSYTAFNGTLGVTVHCYSTNYQLITVFGLIQSLKIDFIDSTDDDLELDLGIGDMGSLGSVDLTNTIILLVKRILQIVIFYFLNGGLEVSPEPVV